MGEPAEEQSLSDMIGDAFDEVQEIADEEEREKEDTAAEKEVKKETNDAADEITEKLSEGEKKDDDDTDGSDDADDGVDDVDADSDSSGDSSAEHKETEGDDVEHKAEVNAAKAPAAWTPTAKEHWKDVPASVQHEITKRETEVASTLSNTTQQRQTAETLEKVLQPFQSLFVAEGAQTPFHAIHNTFTVVSRLRMGTPVEKASQIYQLMNVYDIDANILADVIEKKPPQEQSASAADVTRLVNEGIQTYIDKTETAAKIESEAKLVDEINTFAKGHEFFDDVQDEMNFVAAQATKKGQVIPLEDMYTQAVNMRPDLVTILDNRTKAGGDTKLSKSDLRAKKAAASSVNGVKQGSSNKKVSTNIEDDIANSIESLNVN